MNIKLQSIFLLITILSFFTNCSNENSSENGEERDEEVTSRKTEEERIYLHSYNCLTVVDRCNLDILKLYGRDSLIYISSSEFHSKYSELHASLTPVNDSIYEVKTTKYLQFSGNGEMPFYRSLDTLAFDCAKEFANNTLSMTYENGTTEEHTLYGEKNKIPFNRYLFNSTNDHLKLRFGYQHPLVEEEVELNADYMANVHFGYQSVDELFYVVISDSKIKTLQYSEDAYYPEGLSFALKRYDDSPLPRGRKLRR